MCDQRHVAEECNLSLKDAELTPKIDVVDCTSMDANINGIRHSDPAKQLSARLDATVDVCGGVPPIHPGT